MTSNHALQLQDAGYEADASSGAENTPQPAHERTLDQDYDMEAASGAEDHRRLNAISFSSSDTIPDEMRDVQLDDTVREHSNDNHDGQKSSDGRSSGMVATQAAMVSVQDLLSAFSVKAGQMMRSDDCEGMLALLEALERAAEDVVISRSPQRID